MIAFRLRKKSRTTAAAIMLALWALFLLSAMVITWALDINTRLTLAGGANRLLEAEAMACSGAEVAMHPMVAHGAPVLRGSFPPNQSYEARRQSAADSATLRARPAAPIAEGTERPETRSVCRAWISPSATE